MCQFNQKENCIVNVYPASSVVYTLQCLNIEQTKHLFIRKETDHPMKKRFQETYEVIHANTERFRNSTVPYIQRLMNKKA